MYSKVFIFGIITFFCLSTTTSSQDGIISKNVKVEIPTTSAPNGSSTTPENHASTNGTTETTKSTVVTTTPIPPTTPKPTTNVTSTTSQPTNPTTTTSPTNVTTTISPPTNATTTTSSPANITTTTISPTNVTTTTSSPANVTTEPAVSPSTDNGSRDHSTSFDGASFVGGIVLTVGLTAIAFIAFKFYKAGKLEMNYRTL